MFIKVLLIFNLFFSDGFFATSYCLKGKTASGINTRRGIVAGDPRVLPLGTKIKVSGTKGYDGIYTVADTGGKIKGRKIDIYLPSCSESKKFGVRKIFVSIL